ncbi:MAG: DNA polymerase III subunit gamma/tau, partial [Planctomycetota bacterium]
SNTGVDDVRELRESSRYVPAGSRYKIYIIDEVHRLSKSAFDALLKTLEEPPDTVKFIFATTEPHKLLDTIRSRCQRFDFRRIPATLISKHLATICKKEKIKAADGVLDAVARCAHGGMRDAESLLDQLAALAAGEITADDIEELTGAVSQKTLFNIIGAVAGHEPRAAVEMADAALAKGAAYDELIQQLIEGFRELLLARVAGADNALIDRGDAERRIIEELAPKFTTDALMFLVQMFAETKQRARISSQSRIVLELALIKAAGIHELRPLDEILSRLRALELGGRGGGGRTPAPPPKAETRRSKPAAPPVEAAPAPPPPTGDLWADAAAIVEQKNHGLAAFMADGVFRAADGPVEAGEAKFIIELDPIAAGPLEKNKGLIEKALSKVSGKKCLIELRSGSGAAGAKKRSDSARQEPKGAHVKKAMGLFNARVVATSDSPGAPGKAAGPEDQA